MLIDFFIVFFYYLKSLVAATFQFEKNKPLYISGYNLTKRSFRITQVEKGDSLVVLKRSLSSLKSLQTSPLHTKHKFMSNEVVYDLSVNSKLIRQDYIEHFTGIRQNNFIFKNELIFSINWTERCVIAFVLTLFLPFWFLSTLFAKNKSSLALFYTECIENASLLSIIRRNKIKKIYFFCIYEKDANLSAYLLMKKGVFVIKLPSEVPFYFFNTAILTNKLIICNAYQSEELEVYKSTLCYEQTEIWGPEQISKVFKIYKERKFRVEKSIIAFYSTASWVREREGHIDQGTNMVKNETMLLGYLNEFIKTNPNYSLLVYLHPKEKVSTYLRDSELHYKRLLPDINFSFAPFELASSASFYKAGVAVAFNSTIIHERLFFGFKTLILPLDHPGFPVVNSGLSNICCYSKEELFQKLSVALKQSEDEFFEVNRLSRYRSKELF